MAWHFIILYTPFFDADSVVALNRLFFRQVLLNLSLTVSFGLFALIGARYVITSARRRMVSLITSVGFCVVGVFLGIVASQSGIQSIFFLAPVLMGMGEGLMMLFWLHLYSESSVESPTRYLTYSMILASLLSFFTRNLTPETSLPLIVLLPVVAGLMLRWSWVNTPVRLREKGEKGRPDFKGARRPFISSTVQLAVYGLIFGLIQGSVNHSGVDFLVPFNPFATLGAGLAGTLIALICLRRVNEMNIDLIHKISLIMLVGALLALPLVPDVANILIATVIMCSYILFDVAVMVFVVNLTRLFDLDSWAFLGINRASVYGAFFIGLLIGLPLYNFWSSFSLYKAAFSGATVFLLIVVTTAFMGRRESWFAATYMNEEESASDQEAGGAVGQADSGSGSQMPTLWRQRCLATAEQFNLSPRETEVFMLLAKGRNAEYIQKILFISNHTVKTHIANIYHKMNIHSVQQMLDIIETKWVEG
jgi:DNA-binding CsgD family transcriptional regulator